MSKNKKSIDNKLEIENEIGKKKIQAYDLLQKVYATVAETKRLQQEIAKIENEITELQTSL